MILLRLHFDRVTDLADVKLVGVERVGGEQRDLARRGGRNAPRHPAGSAADDERRNRRRSGDRAPGPLLAHDPVKRQPIRHRLMDHRAVTRADRLGLGAPGGHPGCIVRMVRKPRFDGLAAVRRQLAVDVDVQLVFRHHCSVVDHEMTFLVI